MSHVSPRRVNKEVLEKIYGLLFSAVSSRNISRKDQKIAFSELLTPTEKIMLGKRLAAVSMFSQGESAYRVGKTLRLSDSTTARIKNKIERGKFFHTKKLCTVLRKGPLQHYIENLFKPLPRYGTSPAQLFKEIQ